MHVSHRDQPGTRITPGPREDGRTVEAVGFTGSSPPEQGMPIAPGPREDGRTCATVAATPRKRGYALGSRLEDTRRNILRASSTTSSFETPATSWINSQDVRVALRFGYGNMGLPTSFQALRSTSSREIGRNLPLYTIKEDRRKMVTSGLHPDPCKARGSSSAPGASPAANDTMEDKRSRQSLTQATPLATICAPPYPDES